ncbi:MAG: ISAs1 family transposase [Clostridia bacterium]|nr:ISAs1 family transposase [Clostridia bacterium]
MSIIDSHELNNVCIEFIFRLVKIPINPQYDFYHFDGKVENSRGRKTNAKNEIIKNLNVLNVYSDLLSMCIDQEMIEEKTNEITAIPDVIKRLNIEGVICTWDALNTQKNTVKAVIERKGDYVGALKGNQGNFYQDVIDYFDEDRLLLIQSQYEGAYKKEIEKSHSQIITYEYYQTEKVKWYSEIKNWEGLKSIGLVIKTIEDKTRKKTEEKRYYISSLLLDIYNFSKAIRNHWNIENKLHWQLDFTFKADENTTVNKKALFNLQIIKKFALNILNQVKEEYRCSLKKIRFQISLNAPEELEKIFKIMEKKLEN